LLISTFYYKFVLNQITTKMNEKKKRPDFLTVLCILSFIGIAFALYTNIRTILDPDAYILKIEQSQEMMEEMGSQEGFLATLSKMGEVHPKILENLSIFYCHKPCSCLNAALWSHSNVVTEKNGFLCIYRGKDTWVCAALAHYWW
jgi:hypothetical protein